MKHLNDGCIHVVNVIHNLSREGGGVAKVVVDMSDQLACIPGLSVSICTSKNLKNSISPNSKNVELKNTGLVFGKNILDANKSVGMQIIHSHGMWLPINHFVSKHARNLGVPLVIQPHGMLEPWALNAGRVKKLIAMLGYQRHDLDAAQLLIATADSEYDTFRSLGLKNPIAVIPNGINLNEFTKINSALSYNLKQQNKNIIFMSRIHPKKGILNLVQAWDRIDRNGWKLLLAGPNENNYLSEVLALISKHNLNDSIEYVGELYNQDKIDFYNGASLFVLPTYSENFGLVIAEALACGIPVITTKGTPWADLEKFACGWWIDIGVEPLVTALQQAMALSDEQRIQMGKNGCAYVQRYNWQDIADQMAHTYRWLLGQDSRPECIRLD